MNKIKKRALIILFLALFMILGAFSFLISLEENGANWAGFASNTHTHNQGVLISGQIKDRNGVLLLSTEDGERVYNENRSIRLSTLHAVGDAAGNIGGSAVNLFAKQLMGYNMVNGVYSGSGKGRDVYLTIDAELNEVAWEALNGRSGCVAVMDYTTGELLCMVSSPAFDPTSPPEDPDYLNRFFTGLYPPGSIFKLVTAYAAIEEIPDLDTYQYTCTGSAEYGDGEITCKEAHGTLTFKDALAVSCNGCFADLAQQLGGETLAQYAEKAGLTASFEVDGFSVATGSFAVADTGSAALGWSGAGQYHDLVNPCAMLRYVGAIANGGKACTPCLLKKVTTTGGIPLWLNLFTDTKRLMNESTAAELKEMMAYNVRTNYGVESFPGLPMCAKSGTAEVEEGATPHAWFTGFLNDTEHPYAFIVLVENGGSGSTVAGAIANTVLQTAVAD
jgi:cell division protein FtsI/penicillin-binding protein 2